MTSTPKRTSKKTKEERNKILWMIIAAGLFTVFPFSIIQKPILQFMEYDSLLYNLTLLAIFSVPKLMGLFIYCCTPISKIKGVRTMSILGFIILIFVVLNLNSGLNASGWNGIGYATLAYGGCLFVYYPLTIALFVVSLVRLYNPKKNVSRTTPAKN